MLRPLYEILTNEDLAALVAAGVLMSEEADDLREKKHQADIDNDWPRLVKQRALALLAEKNEAVTQAREIRRVILAHGGIKQSDYESIPASYKRKTGYALDEIAQELNTTDAALMLDITGAENILHQLPAVNGKRCNRYRIVDVIAEAEASLIAEHGTVTGD